MGYTKLVQTGNLIEVYNYEKQPYVSLHRGSRKGRSVRNPYALRRVSRRGDSYSRARKSFRRIVLGNISRSSPALLTLTMLDILGIRDAYKCFTAFGQRLRRAYGQMVCWVAVPEFQKRGAVHFHLLVWGIPDYVVRNEKDTRDIQNLWGYGYVDIRATDGHPKLASYLSKYMSKAMQDSRLVGVKSYSVSRQLMRSVSVSSPSAIDIISKEFGIDVIHSIPLVLPEYEKSYDTMWLGRATYKRYIIKSL